MGIKGELEHLRQQVKELEEENEQLSNKKEVLKSALLLVLHFFKEYPPFWTAESNAAWSELHGQLVKKLKPLREIPKEALG